MELPQKIRNFIEEKTAMTNMALSWNYPSIDKFNDFQAGYRFNANTLKSLTGQKGEFDKNWFVICTNYFDDPFFIDISETKSDFPVYYAQHGAGSWTQVKIAENITEFTNQLKELKKIENNKDLLLSKLKNEFNLENELWNEVYESILEEEDDEE
ncbi:SMI1/KNR4 family protein [Sphingobacterium phlebotomi]|uniref:SMI1/KNR4 family protein n=1 Tax=Sphingobacterium phlebotomi TaxID=2605433 RepID=A0A5D4H682_9SPHI|nr:SMI1/KNR4 family protein [Sphingobacterium phlebotomi]TYR35792.1 SMI1/KNR4 family protein [Sphingobacterium phlebotomi]